MCFLGWGVLWEEVQEMAGGVRGFGGIYIGVGGIAELVWEMGGLLGWMDGGMG